MNKVNVTIVVIAAAVLLAVGSAQTTEAGPVGRYQIVYGEHQVVANFQSVHEQKEILRIDTVTGKTSKWTAYSDGDAKNGVPPKSYSYWVPIDESMVAH